MKKIIIALALLFSISARSQTFDFLTRKGVVKTGNLYDSASVANLIAAKQSAITVTPYGVSGNVTLVSNVLNVPRSYYVTISEYGGDSTGTSNSNSAMQAAVNSGKPVYVNGTYLITAAINLQAAAKIFGRGDSSIIKTTSNINIFNITGDGVMIDNIRLQGNSTGAVQNGISVVGTSNFATYYKNCMFTNCRFENLANAGIYSQYNLGTSDHASNIVSNCIFNGCGKATFFDTRAEYFLVSNCKFYGCTYGGYTKGGNNSYVGGSSTNNTYGMFFGNGANNSHSVVSGMSISHNTTRGIWCDSIGGLGQTFIGCMIYQNASEDIYLRADTGVRFVGCDIYATAINVQASINTVFDNVTYPITPTFNFAWNGTNNTGTLSAIEMNNPHFLAAQTLSASLPTSYSNRFYTGFFQRGVAGAAAFGLGVQGIINPFAISLSPSSNAFWYNPTSTSIPNGAFINSGGMVIGDTTAIASTDLLGIIKDQNTGTSVTLRNANTGSAGYSVYRLVNSVSGANFGLTSTGYAPSGINVANGAFFSTSGTGGLSIAATDAAGIIRFYTGGSTSRISIGTSGQLGMNGTSSGTVTIQAQATAGVYNFNLPITAGTSGQYLTSGGGSSTAMTWTTPTASVPLQDYIADVNNSGSAETDIFTYTIAANTLNADKQKIEFGYTINLTDLTATAQIKTYMAGTVTGNTGALTVSATGSLIVTGYIIRTSSTTARVSVNISSPTASTAVYTSETDLTSLNFATTNIVKVTAQAGGGTPSTGDCVGKMGFVKFIPASP